jgi:polysaccharide biosynthesis protein PslG
MKIRQYPLHLLIVLSCLLFVVACQPQPPILVYVTPTQEAEVASAGTAVPTVDLSPAATSTAITPTTDVPTLTETPTVTASAAVGTPAPTTTFEGSVIQPGYTLPPTSTPRPTLSPTPTETPLPGVTPTTETPPQPPTSEGPKPTALPGLDAARMGIQLDPTLSQQDWNNAIGDIQRLGVKWLKVQVAWSLLEPQKGVISEDFRRLEIYLETANQAGLDILISIAKAPPWSRPGKPEDGPPDNPQDLYDFVRLFLGEVGKGVDAVEIWNEPNLQREWGGLPLTGQSYMSYFVPAYNAAQDYIQSAQTDPVEPRTVPLYIITAGLAPTQGEGAADDRAYLQQMYSAGLGQYPDVVVGVHPYGWGNPPDSTCCGSRGWDDNRRFFFKDTLDDYRQIMVSNGASDSKMWLTEVGWATWAGLPGDPPDAWMGFTDECQQGNYLVQAFQMSQALDYLGPMFLWNLNFAVLSGMVDNRDERAGYSLIVPLEPRERAAYWMLYASVHGQQLPSYSRCPGAG